MKYLLVILLLVSCGKSEDKAEPQDPPARLAELEAKAELYLSLQDGWLPGCDSLLFSSLTAVGGADIDITEARDEQGRWFRTPSKDCYPNRSKSTISKDMLLGLLVWAYKKNRPDVLEQVMADHRPGYVMGEGPFSRTIMTPSLQGLYAKALVALGGKRYEPEYWYPPIYLPVDGYQAHLQAWGIYLDCKLTGSLPETALKRMGENLARNPRNALHSFVYHAFVTGDLNDPVNILLDDPAWPDDRLPGSSDRCEPWVIQRELGDDWEPCDEGETFSGGELLVLYELIKDEVE